MKKLIILLFLFVFLSVPAQDQPELKLGSHIITNHQQLPDLLQDYYDGARYYKVDYAEKLITLNKVLLVHGDMNFLGTLVEIDGGKEIWINSILPIRYPNLFKIIFYRQMGKLYDLPEDESPSNLDIMSTRWELSPKYENWAYNKLQRHTIRRIYFEKLAKKLPLDKKL